MTSRPIILSMALFSVALTGASAANLAKLNEFRADHGLAPLKEEQSKLEARIQTAAELKGAHLSGLWEHWEVDLDSIVPNDDLLKKALRKSNFRRPDKALAPYVPKNPVYRALQRELENRRQSVDTEMKGFVKLPSPDRGKIVKVGQPYGAIDQLAELLVAGGYLPKKPSGLDGIYTQPVADGVKAYQADQGLESDGIIGLNTLQSLNLSPKAKLDLLVLNINRARLLPDDLGVRHIMVNLPGGMVYAMDQSGGRPALMMRVVYGKATHDKQTTIFRDQMEHVVFRPYWRIPMEIAEKEIVPKALSDPDYLAQKNYSIVANYDGNPLPVTTANLQKVAAGELKMRQDPGGQNSLGLVKFLFPNDHAIYLHDTPADQLFSQSKRDFSHGCVRLEKPEAMAEWVLNDSKWTADSIGNAMSNSGEDNQWINLEKKINVYLAYFTAFPAPGSSKMRYYQDVYSRDSQDANQLAMGE